ncbi:DUF1294 domain-containing protein [Halalkalibacterium ligniniphilum]|uniref:DUF1294 domain-containing protein n=1 Tax=Halalkalibacterium ligniniphilum TaxID=1134413 RepID=UPI00034A205D|nr:DUF1294 domain-containing protein [Halalkalibacterium ligniniphilum]
MEAIVGYFIVVNVLGYFVMGIDKQKARQQKRRIPERTLFLLALFGGSLGIYGGMKQFRHKTKHRTFSVGMPLLILAQLLLGVFIFFYLRS